MALGKPIVVIASAIAGQEERQRRRDRRRRRPPSSALTAEEVRWHVVRLALAPRRPPRHGRGARAFGRPRAEDVADRVADRPGRRRRPWAPPAHGAIASSPRRACSDARAGANPSVRGLRGREKIPAGFGRLQGPPGGVAPPRLLLRRPYGSSSLLARRPLRSASGPPGVSSRPLDPLLPSDRPRGAAGEDEALDGAPARRCASTISGTSAGVTPPYQTASG